MSKPFTYWVRLALVATLCTLITFSPVSAGRLMDRLLHRDACKSPAKDHCDQSAACPPACLVVPAAQCQMEFAPAVSNSCQPTVMETIACDAAPPCICDAPAPAINQVAPFSDHSAPAQVDSAPTVQPAPPMVSQPAVEVHQPAPTIQQPHPDVQPPAPIVEKPAPAIEKPAPAIEKPAPVAEAPPVKQPDPVFETPITALETPATIKAPAPAPVQSSEPVAPNPFDLAPAKTPDLDVFGDSPVKQPPTADKIPDVVETPVVEKPTAEPEMPAKDDLGSLFDPAPEPKAESKPEAKVEDVFGFDSDLKPAVAEPAPPVVEPQPAKTPSTELEDLFSNEKNEKPVAQTQPTDSIGKPVTAEIELFDEMPTSTKASEAPTEDNSFLDKLFNDTPAKQPNPSAEEKTVEPTIENQPAIVENEKTDSVPLEPTKTTQPKVSQPSAAEPETVKPAKPEKEVDDLDALFGVGAVARPADFQGAEFRVWVDNSGAYQVKARLAVIYADKVKLLKENGKYSTVPLSRLSEADYGYVTWVASNLTSNQTARMVNAQSNETTPDAERK